MSRDEPGDFELDGGVDQRIEMWGGMFEREGVWVWKL